MSNVRCQAKDPNNCRFHKPDAGVEAFNDVQEKHKQFGKLRPREEGYQERLWKATEDYTNALNTYYATDLGQEELRKELENATSIQEQQYIEFKLDAGKATSEHDGIVEQEIYKNIGSIYANDLREEDMIASGEKIVSIHSYLPKKPKFVRVTLVNASGQKRVADFNKYTKIGVQRKYSTNKILY